MVVGMISEREGGALFSFQSRIHFGRVRPSVNAVEIAVDEAVLLPLAKTSEWMESGIV